MGKLDINLSFIISTRNRLNFLKITLTILIQNLNPGEEIVVVDGDSNDGSKDYLLQLFNEGKIHQFISEPDRNQAHGWNKAMLMARGLIIKKIIDDDVFHYSAIRKCADFMLANSEVDVVISNELNASLNNQEQISKSSRLSQFESWKQKRTASFTFSDVHILIRKSALSYIGLYHTDFVMMDWEYALRMSFLRAKIVYFTGYNALSVGHAGSVSANKNAKLVHHQGERARLMYNYPGDAAEITLWSRLKINIGKILYSKNKIPTNTTYKEDITEAYSYFYLKIDEINNQNPGIFII
ncbi:Glycosyltransferase, GT2 family [Pedobacter terrae]|uniref:Glycosyltransferase, GT2 family n=1 Tax=Pedobacter terrae TaxID=405671 RepID=A0A1G7U327_9SPHI|nr:glycosyltransferase [Pedobacter terrae]SDG42035.1 Glycosyltransferase, GT2 family [Pedobacter terrae]